MTRPSTYDQLKEADEFAFVVTDIESSTELSQQDPLAFQQARTRPFDRLLTEALHASSCAQMNGRSGRRKRWPLLRVHV